MCSVATYAVLTELQPRLQQFSCTYRLLGAKTFVTKL